MNFMGSLEALKLLTTGRIVFTHADIFEIEVTVDSFSLIIVNVQAEV